MADANTMILLHLNGADGSTTITDTSPTPHTFTAQGNAQLDTAQKKFGTASLLLDGTGDYISTPHDANLNFGTGNFTIDFWVRWNNKTGNQMFFDKSVDGNDRWIFYKNDIDKISFSATIGGDPKASYLSDSALSLSDGTLYHMALVRNGTTMLFFLDGVSQAVTGSTPVGTNNFGDNTGQLNIGVFRDGSTNPLNGWMDEIRVSNVARWTENFTPPTQEYDYVAPTTSSAFASYLEV